MARIPDALGIYQDEDGDLWVRFQDGRDKWLHLTQWHPTPIDRSWMSEFVTDEDAAEHLPLKCVSGKVTSNE